MWRLWAHAWWVIYHISVQARALAEERELGERLRSAEVAQYEARQRVLRDLDALKVSE